MTGIKERKRREYFGKFFQVLLDDTIGNMTYLFQSARYGAMNKIYPNILGYYVVNYVSGAYTSQEENTFDGKIIKADEIVVKAKYLICTKERKWYREKSNQKQIMVVPTHTILHPYLDIIAVKDVQYTPKSFSIETNNSRPYRDVLYASLTHIMTTFLMKFCVKTKVITKETLTFNTMMIRACVYVLKMSY